MHRFDNFRIRHRLLMPSLFAAAAILLLFALPYSNWDAAISGYYYDPLQALFPLRNEAQLKNWLHDDLRGILWLSPLAVIACLLASVRRNGWSLRSQQWFWLLCAQLAAPLAVSILKMHTSPICPWDSLQYGGRLVEPAFALVSADNAGHCFPAGHPSAGWGLIAYCYFWRSEHPRLARIALMLALAIGAVMAWVQIARGAHLLSHVLWSLWVCWLVIWLLYRLAWPGGKERPITRG